MKKYISIIVVVIAALLALIFGSCSSDDNSYEVSDEWKNFQANVVTRVVDAIDEDTGKKIYTPLLSESGLGRIYYKPSDYITNNQAGNFDDEGPSAFAKKANRPIYESDNLLVRYEGWYYNMDDKKIIFDSTEININTGTSMNNQKTAIFVPSPPSPNDSNIDGFKTILLDMEVGEERIVCIPYIMAYGVYGDRVIPGYTTLFFDLKILKNLTEEAENK